MKCNGEPLRQSRELPFLSRPTNASESTGDRHYLYEAQTSVIVTGIDDQVWTAYGFVDTYFASGETGDNYDTLEGRLSGRPDPLAAGQLNADQPIWTSREYFLKVFEIRSNQVLKEWDNIACTVEEVIKRYVLYMEFVGNLRVFLHLHRWLGLPLFYTTPMGWQKVPAPTYLIPSFYRCIEWQRLMIFA
jgi:hypothetical protein